MVYIYESLKISKMRIYFLFYDLERLKNIPRVAQILYFSLIALYVAKEKVRKEMESSEKQIEIEPNEIYSVEIELKKLLKKFNLMYIPIQSGHRFRFKPATDSD
ncbi:MAG: hypothetical protein AB1410_01345 [Acidobacteriota bacterium]